MRLLYVTNQICGSGGLERVLAIKTAYLIEKYGYEILNTARKRFI